MNTSIEREIAALQQMTIGELRRKHEEVFGETPRTGNKAYLWKRIAWRIQELQYGGLSERAKQRAEELANDADLRVRPPRGAFAPRVGARGRTIARRLDSTQDARLPMPGTVLTRTHRGRRIEVKVLDRGFDFRGKTYRSLSAVAKAATGTQWNGFAFFGLARGAE